MKVIIKKYSNNVLINPKVDKTIKILQGRQGLPGTGMIDGGLTDQVLSKSSDIDYQTQWVFIDHNNILNSHNLTTDIDHNALTNYTITEHRIINDSSILNTDLWSASKINSELGNKEDNLTFSTGLTNTAQTITTNDSQINHNILQNTHNLTTDIDHDTITNNHNLTTDIDHNTITNNHNLTTDIDHDLLTNFVADEHIDWSVTQVKNIHSDNYINTTYTSSDFDHNNLTNNHNLTTDIDHDTITNTHNLTTDIDHDTITNTHNLTTDIDHDTILNNHNLTTDIDHNTITNYESDEHFTQTEITTLYQPDGTNGFVYTDNSGTLHIDGNITQSGATYETHAEQIYTTKDFIITRDGAVAGLSAGEISGMQVLKYDGTNDLIFGTDNTGFFKVGETGSLQTLATREDNPTDGHFMFYDATTFQLKGKALTKSDITDFSDGDYEVPLTFSTGLSRTTNTITTNDGEINHNSLQNTHNLTTDINHNTILNNHNLTTDIDHNALTNYDVAEHRTINDSATGITDLWSASKINTELGLKLNSSSAEILKTEFITLTSTDITNKYKDLVNVPVDNTSVKINIIGGSVQFYTDDYTVITNGSVVKRLNWDNLGMETILAENDKIVVNYTYTS